MFGYAIDRPADAAHLAIAQTGLIALDHSHTVTRLPAASLGKLSVAPDPVRIPFK